jgi:hypothetical protein
LDWFEKEPNALHLPRERGTTPAPDGEGGSWLAIQTQRLKQKSLNVRVLIDLQQAQ